MNNNAAYPCNGCTERTVVCHAVCPHYAEARERASAQADEAKKQKRKDTASADVLIESRMRFKRRIND